jgi:hypothetical protein
MWRYFITIKFIIAVSLFSHLFSNFKIIIMRCYLSNVQSSTFRLIRAWCLTINGLQETNKQRQRFKFISRIHQIISKSCMFSNRSYPCHVSMPCHQSRSQFICPKIVISTHHNIHHLHPTTTDNSNKNNNNTHTDKYTQFSEYDTWDDHESINLIMINK